MTWANSRIGSSLKSVVVKKILELPSTVGKSRELGPRQLLRIIEQIGHVRGNRVRAVLFRQRDQGSFATDTGGDRGIDVADHCFRNPHV